MACFERKVRYFPTSYIGPSQFGKEYFRPNWRLFTEYNNQCNTFLLLYNFIHQMQHHRNLYAEYLIMDFVCCFVYNSPSRNVGRVLSNASFWPSIRAFIYLSISSAEHDIISYGHDFMYINWFVLCKEATNSWLLLCANYLEAWCCNHAVSV